MLVLIYVHGVDEPLVREAATVREFCKYISDVGCERMDKIILTDFRPTIIIDGDGKKTESFPDFETY